MGPIMSGIRQRSAPGTRSLRILDAEFEMTGPVFHIERIDTPIGETFIVTDAAGALRSIDWSDHAGRLHRRLEKQSGPGLELREAGMPSNARRALDAYFAGELAALDAVRTEATGTDFQRDVWRALRDIPLGETSSYGELARRIGRPKAVRAVGMANGANPIPIVVPCHRVIGADASLTGFGGGLDRKRWLLAHEGVDPARWGEAKQAVLF